MHRFKWLGLIVSWVVLTFILLEGGLRLVGMGLPGQLGVTARYVITGQPYAEDWTQAWQENRDHYYTLRPNVQNALQYGTPTFNFRLTTHKLWDDGLAPDEGIGFRTRPIDYRVDAVVVGDSFGFCFTEEDDCWVNLLESATGLGIANLSQPVTGSISHAKMLQDFGAPLTPPLVIWQFFGNDFNDDYGLLVWRGDAEAIADPDDTTLTAEASDKNGVIDWLRRNSVAFAILEVATTGQWSGTPEDQAVFTPQHTVAFGQGETLAFDKPYERRALDMRLAANQFGYAQSQQAFQDAQALLQTWDGQLLVVLIPTREEVYAHLTEPLMGQEALDTHRSARLAMRELCETLALQCLDPLADFQARAQAGEVLYYGDDMHLNAAGNRALSALLEAWIAENFTK